MDAELRQRITDSGPLNRQVASQGGLELTNGELSCSLSLI